MKSYIFGACALLLLSAFTFTACKDNEDGHTAPTLTVTAPTEGGTYAGSLNIRADVVGEDLHEMKVTLTKDSDGSTIFEEEPTVHDLSDYTYTHTTTFSGLSGDTPMTLTVWVENHDEQAATKTIHFTAQP